MLAILLMTISLATLARADVDAKDLIARGYTCSLSSKKTEFGPSVVGTEIICDDGICIECVLTDKKPQSFLQGDDVDVEDFLKAGYSCSQDKTVRTPQPGVVCDDGVCFRCTKKPVVESIAIHSSLIYMVESGDVDDYLENDHTCFLVSGLPNEAFKDDVVIVCDDGDCFGCMKNIVRSAPIAQLVSTTAKSDQFPVTKRFIDDAEDLLEDFSCGFTIQPIKIQARYEKVICEGSLCLVCGPNTSSREDLVRVTESTVEVVEDLVDTGFTCVAVLERVKATSTPGEKIVCDKAMCFICRI